MTDRIKTQIKQHGTGIQTSTQSIPGPAPIFSTIAAPPQSVACSVLYGDNDPNWKTKLRQKEGVVTYLGSSNLESSGNSFFTGRHVITNWVHGTRTERRFWGDACTLCDLPAAATDISVSKADNMAKMKFIKKAIAAQQSLQGLVALGELRETINLIRHPLQSLRHAVDKLTDVAWNRRQRFGKINSAKRLNTTALRKVMADTYLEWAFGAQPLVQDILSGCEAASRILTYNPPHVFCMGQGHHSNDSTDVEGVHQGGNGIRCTSRVRRTQESFVRYYGSVWTQIPGLNGFSGQLGVRLMDVIPAVWELIPYSFLVDYFTNAQEMVNAACFPTSSIRWAARGECTTSTNELCEAECTYEGGLGFGDVIEENSLAIGTGCKTIRSEKVRYGYDGGWIPSLEFEIPSTTKKWLNIAALALSGTRLNGVNRL